MPSSPAAKTRIAVWGVGMFGGLTIRLMQNRPDLQLVAALSYGETKIGQDAGEVVGVGHLGVPITADPQALIDSKPDCVMYLPKDFGDYRADADIIRLLEAGCNVITPLPYSNLKWRGGDIEARIQAAAERGQATFVVTGVDPDFMWERQLLTLTGLCAEVEHIHIKEIFRGDTIGAAMFPLFGFGTPVEEARKNQGWATLVRNYVAPSMDYACAVMGRRLDRVEAAVVSSATPRDIELPQMTVKAGTVGLSMVRIEGYIGDKVFATHDMMYFLTDVTRPPETVGDECWIIEIEGKPSLRMSIEALASVREGTYRYPGDPNSPAGYYVCVGPVINAIPLAVSAPPGIHEPAPPELHWQNRRMS